MRVARDTGRSVLDVARDSFALTLYTNWHLQQLDAVAAFEREVERHDMGALTAFAFNEPKKLMPVRRQSLGRHRIVVGARSRRRVSPERIALMLAAAEARERSDATAFSAATSSTPEQ